MVICIIVRFKPEPQPEREWPGGARGTQQELGAVPPGISRRGPGGWWVSGVSDPQLLGGQEATFVSETKEQAWGRS